MSEQLNDLMKALEAGQYNAAPSTLVQGSALQIEDLSPVMHVVCVQESDVKLQKMFGIKDHKSTLIQFNRQLSYGNLGSSAQFEGSIGEEQTGDFVRIVVPMAFYSQTRRTSIAANLVQAFDGVKAEDRQARDATANLAFDIEFDAFRGLSDFSNAGLFDGNLAAAAKVPSMVGVDMQIRESDALSNTQDLMFAEYGSDQTVVIPVNGTLTQSYIEDAAVRSRMNAGQADAFITDPIALSAYNKLAHAKERIVLAGSAQEASGASLRTQWTSVGPTTIESSRFLSGKTRPARSQIGSPAAPATVTGTHPVEAASVLAAGSYIYTATAVNMRGESVATASSAITPAAGDKVLLSIAAVSGASHFNVYRSEDGGTAASAKFIGRVRAASSGATAFSDLGHKAPGSVAAYLLQKNQWEFAQLAPYSRLKLAISDLSLPEAHFRFLCLQGFAPRKNVILDSIDGQLA